MNRRISSAPAARALCFRSRMCDSPAIRPSFAGLHRVRTDSIDHSAARASSSVDEKPKRSTSSPSSHVTASIRCSVPLKPSRLALGYRNVRQRSFGAEVTPHFCIELQE